MREREEMDGEGSPGARGLGRPDHGDGWRRVWPKEEVVVMVWVV